MRLADQRDLVRARLHPGQRVRIFEGAGGPEGAVVGPAEPAGDPDGPWRYRVAAAGAERVVAETELDPLGPRGLDPLEALRELAWRGARPFAARLELLRTRSLWFENAFGIPAFLGARIVPLPHQVHAARRVLTDRVPRFVLADEVGLGKTIEAGLVLQALAATRADLRVLVVAPGAMTRQWLCELFLRFGEQVFVHVDAPRLEEPEAEALLAAPRLIVSTVALEAFPELRERLFAAPWDVLVIDEAHQVHPDAPLYGLLRRLARHAWGLLALSATPAKGDLRGLLGLLGLVAPDVYDPARPEAFARAFAAREAVAGELEAALTGLEGDTPLAWRRERAAALAELLPDDPSVTALAARVAAGEAPALDELVAHVQEHHRVDRRIVRTRRATVRALGTPLCEREREVVRYDAPPEEVAVCAHVEGSPAPAEPSPLQAVLRGLYRRRVATDPLPFLALLERRKAALAAGPGEAAPFDPLAALAADPGPAEEEYVLERVVREAPPLPGEAEWLAEAVRLTHAWLVASLEGGARTRAALAWIRKARRRGKVLVFAQDREVVEAFTEALRDALGPDAVGAIHHGLGEQRLGEVALRFQQPDGPCRVLVSDELGGEGRNFQVARAVLHLDQPWAVGRLEQRIGRLDRIGRRADAPVRSVVLVGPAASERALHRLHDEALGVYRRSLGGLELLLPAIQRRVTAAACAGAADLEALAGPLTEEVAAERTRADESAGRALDASARSLEEAAEQAEILADVDGADDAASLARWAGRLGIKIELLDELQWRIGWSWEHLRRVPDGLAPGGVVPEEGRVRRRGTFSRAKALEDESLEFFAPGHPFVDALVRDLLASPDGRTAALTRNLGPERRGHLHLLVAAETAVPDADLPEGLRHRARGYLWPQVRTGAARLLPGRDPAATPVADRALLAALERTDSSDRTLDPDDLARAVDLAELWGAVEEGVASVLDALRTARAAEVADAADRLGADVAGDVAFLRSALARAASDEERVALERELADRERLVAAVRAEEVTPAAVALILGV